MIFVVHHARSGVVALNVVTAALDGDARTQNTEIRFARTKETLVEQINQAKTEADIVVVGWSFYSPDFSATISDLQWVKEQVPAQNIIHLAGGVHATAEPLDTLRAGFDYLVLGEGENTTVEIFAALKEGRPITNLKGVAYLENGQLISRGPGERRPLDDFLSCNLRYAKWNALEITRGCVYACTFCQTPYMFKARFRHRSVQNIRAHVEHMNKHGSRFFRFLTPTSLSYGSDDESVNLDAISELLANVREAAGKEAKVYFGTFPLEIRPEHISPEALQLLKRYCDNQSIIVGGQSGSERVLNTTKRGHQVEDVIRAVRISIECGFRPDVDFLIGLPGETTEDRLDSVKLAQTLVSMGARIHSHSFMPLPGTPLRDAVPETIEPAIENALSRLESQGAMYGQWRTQQESAKQLVQLRRSKTA